MRVNESADNHDFYTRTNKLAHSLDDSRQTGGIRYKYDSELLEDVMTMNDFQIPLRAAESSALSQHRIHRPHVPDQAQRQHRAHHRTHDAARARAQSAGVGQTLRRAASAGAHLTTTRTRTFVQAIGFVITAWLISSAFPNPRRAFIASQCDPKEEIVLEPAFDWSRGDRNESFNVAMICSNCEHLKIYIGNRLVAEADPDRENFGNLTHPPFVANIRSGMGRGWGDLKIEGYIGGKLVVDENDVREGS